MQMTILLPASQSKALKFITHCYYHSATRPSPLENLLSLLHLSASCKSLGPTKQCHARVLSLGFAQNPFLATKLISAYAAFGVPRESELVFNSIQFKSVYLWNSLINGYVKNHGFSEAFDLFCRMGWWGVFPDDYTLATMAKVCGEVGDLQVGKMVHAKCLRIGFVWDIVAANSLMSMYTKCGELRECRKLFDEMSQRNVGSWNVVIAGYAESGDGNLDEEILGLVQDMQVEGFKLDAYTISSLLPLRSGDGDKCDYGREFHAYIVRNELESDVHLRCCLIDMYSRGNKVCLGRRVFEQAKARSVYTWTAMMSGFVQNGALKEAFVLFRAMQVRDGVAPNKVTLISVLPACISLAGLNAGKQIHGYAVRKQLNHDVSLCNALIDMYSKCGSLSYALHVFEDSSLGRDAISWSSIISGYGLHGKGEEAVSMYRKMLQLENKPDMIIVVGVLSACGKSRLVDEGLQIYNSAINEHRITPTVEICACVVDMLGRSGHLGQALDFIRTMPVEPGPSIWGSLVSASFLHGNSQMQDLAYKFLIQLEPENPSNYVSLSNLHASFERWGVVAEVRTMMKERGLRKTPGCSWISINNTTHCFYATDKLHPRSKSIYEMLDVLILLMKASVRSYDWEFVT